MNYKNFLLIIVFIALPSIFLLNYKNQDSDLSSPVSIQEQKLIEKSKDKDSIQKKPKFIPESKTPKTDTKKKTISKNQTTPQEDFNINVSFEDNKYYKAFLKNFHKGDFKNALIYGKNLLKIPDKYSKEYWYGNVIHTTNIILGKINFALGNIQTSEFYLLNSIDPKYISKTPNGIYSPQLSSFGPETSLAYDLYKSGQRESVLKYFQGLNAFWKTGIENGYIDNSIWNIKNRVKIHDLENDFENDENTGFPYKEGLFSIPGGESED